MDEMDIIYTPTATSGTLVYKNRIRIFFILFLLLFWGFYFSYEFRVGRERGRRGVVGILVAEHEVCLDAEDVDETTASGHGSN
jgi:hypothetical protein